MNQVTKLETPKPCIEVEVRGDNFTGKSTVAGVIAKALKEAFPEQKIVLTSTDGMLPADISHATPEEISQRLRRVGTIQVLDIDAKNLKS